ncbi:MAG: SHOCT domain-containing protein [Nitrosopumilus sp.]
MDVEFSPFPILIIQEHARRFNNKTKNEIIKGIQHQAKVTRNKVKGLEKSAAKKQTVGEIKVKKSEEFSMQAKKKGYNANDSFLKKSGILGSKLKKRAKNSIKKGIAKGKTIRPHSSSEKNLVILEKLGKLRKTGVITEQEFREKKKKILAKI